MRLPAKVDMKFKIKGDKEVIDGDYQFPHPWIKNHFIFCNIDSSGEWEHMLAVLMKVVDQKTRRVKHVQRSFTYEEKTVLKMFFFLVEEVLVEFIPPNQDYLNNHAYETHLWRFKGTLPVPDPIVVALAGGPGKIVEIDRKPKTEDGH